MSFTAFTNIITILFCLAVLVQSVRMMRSLDRVRESQLDRTVGALDTATAKARSVLSELKETLLTEGAANAQALGEAREVREELNVMVGIANAMAERLIEAASAGSRNEAEPVPGPAETPKTKASRPKAAAPKAKAGGSPKHSGRTADVSRKAAPKKAAGRTPRKSPEPITGEKEFA